MNKKAENIAFAATLAGVSVGVPALLLTVMFNAQALLDISHDRVLPEPPAYGAPSVIWPPVTPEGDLVDPQTGRVLSEEEAADYIKYGAYPPFNNHHGVLPPRP